VHARAALTFYLSFMTSCPEPCAPDDRQVVTCAGDCTVRLHDVNRGVTQLVHRHRQRAKKLVVQPSEPQVVLSCSEDGSGETEPARVIQGCSTVQRIV
jgi:hypothetical protein